MPRKGVSCILHTSNYFHYIIYNLLTFIVFEAQCDVYYMNERPNGMVVGLVGWESLSEKDVP